MTKTYKPPFVQNVLLAGVKFIDSDGTAAKSLLTIGAEDEDARIDVLNAVSDAASAVVVRVELFTGSTSYPIGSVSVPAGAGTDGTTPATDLIGALASPAFSKAGSINLRAGWQIRISMAAAVPSTKLVTVVANGGGY